MEMIGKTGQTALATGNEKFDNRNYTVKQYSLEPKLSFTRGANVRISGGYRYQQKSNQLGLSEDLNSHAISSDVKYNLLQNASLQGKFTYTTIKFPYPTNTTVSYIMLDGLQPGKNLLWSIDLTKRLGRNLEMNIQYEGRKPGENRVIHIGRASLRAIL